MARHKPTDETRSAVTILAGLGAPHGIIAGHIDVTEETLRKCYADELADGPATVRLQTMKHLFDAARVDGAGRVTAAVRLLDLLSNDETDLGDTEASGQPAGDVMVDGEWRRFVVHHPDRVGLWIGDEQVRFAARRGDGRYPGARR